MKERILEGQKNAVDEKRFLTKVSLAAIGLGLVITAVGFSVRDGVWEKERAIREAYPQGSQELWRQLEEQQNLPQGERKSNIIILAGFAFVISGFGVNINLAPKEELKNTNLS